LVELEIVRLAEQWEAKLRAEGLASIDGGEPGATYAPGRIDSPNERDTVASKLRAEFWHRAEIAAAMLPHGWPRGHFIRKAVLLGNVNRASRECRLSQKAGEWAWRKFLVFAGLPAPLVRGSQGRKRPTKPGQLRIEAGRYREERAA
jgi:hypothetical protein